MTRYTEQEYAEVLRRTRRKSRSQATTLPPITEKQWQQDVKDLARMLGWKTYHTLRSKGSDPDFPDLVMARRHNIGPICPEYETRVIVAELKLEKQACKQECANLKKKQAIRAIIGKHCFTGKPGQAY